MNITSYMPTRIISGKNALTNNKEELKALGTRCLIVTGGSSAILSKALDDITKVFLSLDISFSIFNKIEQNPQTVTCHRAGEEAREIKADFLVGIGGGSPLDATKAIAIYAANEDLKVSDIYNRKYNKMPLPVVLIGTTAGTGSEVTSVSVLTDSNTGFKRSISGNDCYAKISYCDPKYTFSMPYSVTVSTALDAFAHAVESLAAATSNEMSKLYAEKAIPVLFDAFRYLDKSNTLPNNEMREAIYYASIFAGLAINITGTCFPHSLGYVLTEDFNIPHGKACTAFFPLLLERIKKFRPDCLQDLMRLTKADENEIISVVNCLTDIESIAIKEDSIKEYCLRWEGGNKNFNKSPGGFCIEDAKKALLSI